MCVEEKCKKCTNCVLLLLLLRSVCKLFAIPARVCVYACAMLLSVCTGVCVLVCCVQIKISYVRLLPMRLLAAVACAV